MTGDAKVNMSNDLFRIYMYETLQVGTFQAFLFILVKFKAQNKKTIKNQHFVTFIFCPSIDDLKPFLCREDNANQTSKPLKYKK